MTKARADEIVRLTFYKYIDIMADYMKRECEDLKVSFEVGRCIGLMQKDLETELAKEVEGKQGTQEFCEWESTESLREKGIQYSSDGLFKPSCNNNEDDFRDWGWIRHFRFCPYCGKRIEVVD